MPDLIVYIDEITKARLQKASERTFRSIEDLVSCAVAETALEDAKRHGEP